MTTSKQRTFCLRVIGNGLKPRIRDGEHVMIDPDHQIRLGDEVVVFLKDGQRTVKNLLDVGGDEYKFGSINVSTESVMISGSKIEKIHYVSGRMMSSTAVPSTEMKGEIHA